MAILGGLFSRKNKSRSKPPSSITSSPVTDFDIESLNDESEYDHSHLHPNTIYQNAAASSSKMKLPFRGNRSKANVVTTDAPSPTDLLNASPQFSTQSEPPHSHLTPPRKSAVFGGYESHETVKTTAPASTGKKPSGGLFSWARGRKKSKAPPPPFPPPSSELQEESFNLRAFRHVSGPDTAPDPDDTAPPELPPARPRPRGDSIASDFSQRVSVAAFREMQARRSQTGSPTPPPTSRPSTQIDIQLRTGSPSLKPPASSASNQSRGRSVLPRVGPRTSTLRSSSYSRSDSGSDSDHGPSPLSVQWKSKSELGHSSFQDQRLSNGLSAIKCPPLRQEKSASDLPELANKRPIPISVHAPARPAAIQTRPSPRPPVRNVPASAKDTPTRMPAKPHDASDSADSEDDAPLATLVQPRRPGSSTSCGSGRSLPPRPLIDIKSLTNSPLSTSPTVSVNPSPAARSVTPTGSRNDIRLPTNINERLSSLAQGITRHKPTSTIVPESTVEAPSDEASPAITGRTAPSRSTTAPPVVVPPVEKKNPVPVSVDKDSYPAPKSPVYSIHSDHTVATPPIDAMDFPLVENPRASLSLDDPTPIKPKPIHHRVPQSGFSVMSRPRHHPSQSTSALSSTSQGQGENDGEPLDSIGDFTAAMFSQLDMGFSVDGGRDSLDSTVTRGSMTATITKSTVASSAVSSNQVAAASGPIPPMVKPVARKEPTPSIRPIISNASLTPPPTSVSESKTKTPPRKLVGRPRSSTLAASVSPQPAQSSEAQLQPKIISRPQPHKPTKTATLDPVGPRKAVAAIQTQLLPPTSRRNRVLSTASTSSESSYGSASSEPSIIPKKQKQPQPQLRPLQTAPRQRSVTMNVQTSTSPPSPTKSSASHSSSPLLSRPPQRPFAMRDKSPSSSTGDSSSGRLPITPRDGSEIGSELGRGLRGKKQPPRASEPLKAEKDGLLSAPNSEMGLKARKLAHRKSVSYDDSTLKSAMKGGTGVTAISDEERRRERRRSEAKNAIELGKVMNGNIQLDDNEDPAMGMNPRVSAMNPMMGMGPMGMGMPQQNVPMMMGNPWAQPNPMLQQFMPPPQNTDSQLMAAHQHAMMAATMAAKQAYQLAVAQQAMQAAGEEWERGSTLGWPSNASAVMFPTGPRSLYAGSIYGGSEYGGPTGGWAAGSVYGGGFGPSQSNRNSAMMRNYQQNGPVPSRNPRIAPLSPETRQPRQRTKTGPDRPAETLIQQQQKGRGRTPPSSWSRGAGPAL